MATARKLLVDQAITPYYHCISKCVRRAILCGDENAHRKQWIEDRLKELAGIFAIDVCGFAIHGNQLHVLLRLDLAKAKAWSAEEVVRRWIELCPPKDQDRKLIRITKAWITDRARDGEWVEECRQRLTEMGWFMKTLKEPIARRANQEEDCTGVFWEGRFRSVAILDQASLLAMCVYIDLGFVATGKAATPDNSPHTSFTVRLDYCEAQGKLKSLQGHSNSASKGNVERGLWLFPIEDRRNSKGKGLAGMMPGISISDYLQLVDWSSRLIGPGTVSLTTDVPDVLTRLQIDPGSWKATLEKLIGSTKSVGTYFGSTTSLNEAAALRGMKSLKNVTGRQTPLTLPDAS